MAEAVVSLVVEQLADLLLKQTKEEIDLLTGVEKKVLNLSNAFTRIRAVLADAERKKITEENVKAWLQDLEDVSYEIDDVLDEWNYTILKQDIEGRSNPSLLRNGYTPSRLPLFFCFKQVVARRDIALKIKQISGRLELIENQKTQFRFTSDSSGVASHSQEWRRVPSTSLIDESEVIGRDSDKSTLLNLLLSKSNESTTQILSIIGTGGVGKTTLAQLVYNDGQVVHHFEKRGWVCVSDPFDEIRVAKAILESLHSSSPNLHDLDSLLQQIRFSTSGKRFLLVLDDVWTEDQMIWDLFKTPLKHGAPGSTILLTTRNERVARVAGATNRKHLGALSDLESWSLFHKVVFSGRTDFIKCERDKFEKIGREVAKKCKGLPLALRIVGSFLRYKNTIHEWQEVMDSKLWKFKEAEVKVFPHLNLSYNDLPSLLRPCFSYCAVFPKDKLIQVDDLIRLWMAQGYLNSGGSEEEMEVYGRECFENLAMRSLFQDFRKDKHDKRIIACKMHDIVHDFAQYLRKRECLVIEEARTMTSENARHITWLGGEKTTDALSNCKMGQARSFFVEDHELEMLTTTHLLQNLKRIRVLKLDQCGLKELPGEIGSLIHLRYLGLSYNVELKELPKTVYDLYNLQTLNLDGCEQVKELPAGIEKLKKLRHLIYSLTTMKFPVGIRELTCLQSLPYLTIGREYNKLSYLKNLNQLRGSLNVWIRDHLDDTTDAQNADLKSKKHIQSLKFYFKDSRVKEDAIEALEPPPELQEIEFHSYKETKLPTWMTSLNNLVKLGLHRCFRLTALPPLGKLPSLEALEIEIAPRSNFADSAFWGKGESLSFPAVGFPELKMLKFGHRHGYSRIFLGLEEKEKEEEWENWEALEPPVNLQILTVDLYGKAMLPKWIKSLQNLKHLFLKECINLTSLLPLGMLPSLEKLCIFSCHQLKFVGPAFLGIRESSLLPAIGFPKLMELEFRNCSGWELWEDISLEDECKIVPLVPRLHRLVIRSCSKLKALPYRLLRKASSLECIKLDGNKFNPYIFLSIAQTLAETKAGQMGHQRTSTETGAQVNPALPTLQHLLYSKDEKELKDVVRALSSLSLGTNDKIQAVIEAGVCERLVELLRHPSFSVLKPALETILHIAAGDDLQKQCIISHGVLPCLLSLLTDNHSKLIKESACQTISYITAGNKDQIQAVIEAGLIAPLLNQPFGTVQIYRTPVAIEAIWNVTSGGTHEQIKFMVSQGCIKPLCDLLVPPFAKVVIACLEALENILKVGEVEKQQGNNGDVNYSAQVIVEAKGLERIRNLKSRYRNIIRERTVEILKRYWPEELEKEDETENKYETLLYEIS